jgi:hypothetical protein
VTTRGTLLAGAVAGVLAIASLAAGCGGGNDGKSESPSPIAKPQEFPQPKGRTLAQLAKAVGQAGPVLSPSISQVRPGANRVGFALFDRARAQIGAAPAAVYVARLYPTAKKNTFTGGQALGPFPARYESLAVKPAFQSRTVAQDPDAAKSVYAAGVRFPRTGLYQVLGVARLDNRLVAATQSGLPLQVTRRSKVPEVGDRAPLIHTPTAADVHGDLSKIDTRTPHDSMHEVDFADVLGKKPIVLIFATPQLCQSRVCGPVVDLVEQLKAERPKDAAYIHMEIYPGNMIKQGCAAPVRKPISQCYRPQVVRWGLPTEPWLFTIDRRGRVAARIEGAFSEGELKRALDAATRR